MCARVEGDHNRAGPTGKESGIIPVGVAFPFTQVVVNGLSVFGKERLIVCKFI